MIRFLHCMIGTGSALLLLGSPAHDSGALLTFGGDPAKAAAAALASVTSEITAHEIGQINEILGLNSQTTTLTTDIRGVREITSRQP